MHVVGFNAADCAVEEFTWERIISNLFSSKLLTKKGRWICWRKWGVLKTTSIFWMKDVQISLYCEGTCHEMKIVQNFCLCSAILFQVVYPLQFTLWITSIYRVPSKTLNVLSNHINIILRIDFEFSPMPYNISRLFWWDWSEYDTI